ncbi:hypothetical protein [Butyrivibrio sp. M55]|uniref:hypothetical protein n=1 Tax=Butyrivibrio sp. M55 TaxID=1855323 RepID=UPI0008E99FE9|nr:hypothetical protein [Butyrivibrio sp. M55]SFU87676.1 hypothetical protein SAMN05216540_11617 [Butyrivibrio sp. M55]
MEKRAFSKNGHKYIVILLVICLVSVCIYHNYNVKKEKENANLKKMYEQQNFAFCMDMEPYYKDFSEDHIQSLIENLGAYEEDTQTTDIVTVEDVKNYLSSEYTKDKKLAILNKPSNIGAYIDWFWHGGDRYAEEYRFWLSNYMEEHPDEYNYGSATVLSEEELYELIDKFKNSPDKKKYEYSFGYKNGEFR